MSLRVKFDPSFIGQEVARQCFNEGRNADELEYYLAGASYAICLTLAKEKPWMSAEFVNIGNTIAKSGMQTFIDLMKTNFLTNVTPMGTA
ncbi:hypothetical protein [Komagataeibacter diospyri]|uniref:hypothetical protein n=1 Tax=Komagataeibacter diospyri TaxID=1932662 RepID=UPI003756AF67